MNDIDYSVVIRTTGKSNKKYIALMDSIDNLIPKPKEIIIVLPEGYDKPRYQLGWETFYFTKKGMVSQRLYGIKQCTTKYALISDDDISFESDFVRKLYEPIKMRLGQFSAGPLYSFLPRRGFNSLICTVNSSAVPTLFNKKKYCKLLRTTGYSYNRNLDDKVKYYEAESLAWTCFLAETESLKRIDLCSENWLDKYGYAAHDDTTMFYKAYLLGMKSIVVSDAYYNHLDAKTSTQGNSDKVIFSTAFNRMVFWHRFIYKKQSNHFKKMWTRICFRYNTIWNYIMQFALGNKNNFKVFFHGSKTAKLYLKSDEYKLLPEV